MLPIVNIAICYDRLPFFSGIKMDCLMTSVLISLIYRYCASLSSLEAETKTSTLDAASLIGGGRDSG